MPGHSTSTCVSRLCEVVCQITRYCHVFRAVQMPLNQLSLFLWTMAISGDNRELVATGISGGLR
jgi:hypothetical protein